MLPSLLSHMLLPMGLDGSSVRLTQVNVVLLTYRKNRPLTGTKLNANQGIRYTSFQSQQTHSSVYKWFTLTEWLNGNFRIILYIIISHA